MLGRHSLLFQLFVLLVWDVEGWLGDLTDATDDERYEIPCPRFDELEDMVYRGGCEQDDKNDRSW